MTPWQWWWLDETKDDSALVDDREFGGWCGEHDSREQAIAQANRELFGRTRFSVIEARSSTAARYEGADCVPFVMTRNRELHQTG